MSGLTRKAATLRKSWTICLRRELMLLFFKSLRILDALEYATAT